MCLYSKPHPRGLGECPPHVTPHARPLTNHYGGRRGRSRISHSVKVCARALKDMIPSSLGNVHAWLGEFGLHNSSSWMTNTVQRSVEPRLAACRTRSHVWGGSFPHLLLYLYKNVFQILLGKGFSRETPEGIMPIMGQVLKEIWKHVQSVKTAAYPASTLLIDSHVRDITK